MNNILIRHIMLASLMLASCFSVFAKDSSQRIITIGDTDISKEEFEYYYNKNKDVLSSERPSSKEYLDLFINFKLKVIEAKKLGYDTVTAYKEEIENYRKQLAEPYLTDDSLSSALIEEEYARMQEDVRASHILLRITDNDTLTAYNRALEVIQKLDSGANFADLVVEYSDDNRTAGRGGDIGFVSGLVLHYSLESALYNCPVGEICGPVRSPAGYHIVKVTDRRPSKGEISVAHILVYKPRTDDSTIVNQFRQRVDSIYEEVKAGADFAQMATKFSQDRSTASKGGVMPWLTVGRTNMYFDDVAFALENPGDISELLETNYGWHIVKLLDKRDNPTFETSRKTIESYISRDIRSAMIHDSFVNKLKEYYNYKPGTGKVIGTFDGIKLTKEGMAEFAANNPRVRDTLKAYVDHALIEHEREMLEEKYPEFALLMQEYRDGVLLFNLSNDSVWIKAAQDTAGLTNYFESNKDKYTWDVPRFKGRIIYCKTPEIRQQAEELAASLPADSVSVVLKRTFNTDGQKNVNVLKSKTYIQGKDAIADYYAFGVGNKPTIQNYEDAFVVGEVLEQPQTYLDVKGTIINDYQKELEKLWLENLRKKYSIKVFYKVLNQVK